MLISASFLFFRGIDGTGQFNFGFETDDIPNQEHLFPLSFGARYNGIV